MEVINLTPHKIDVCDANGKVIKTYPASGKVARLKMSYEYYDYVDGVPLGVRKYGKPANLPKPQEGVMYIVSNQIMMHYPNRTDLIAPVQQVKINGRTVGCRSFATIRRKS